MSNKRVLMVLTSNSKLSDDHPEGSGGNYELINDQMIFYFSICDVLINWNI